MRGGAIFSGVMHLAIILLTVFGLPGLLRSERPQIVPIPVEVIDAKELKAALKKPDPPPKPAKPEPKKPPPPKPPQVAKLPPPAPIPAPAEAVKIPEPEPMPPPPESKPEPPPPEATPEPPPPKPLAKPKPPPEKKPEKKPEPPKPEPKPVAKATPPPKAKPAPAQDAFQTLLKNLAREKEQQERAAKSPPAATVANTAPQRAPTDLQTRVMAAALAREIQRQVTPCWNIPAGAKGAGGMHVAITIRLNPDGSLAAPPQIAEQTRLSDPFFRALAESAQRALRDHSCMPLKGLPLDQYDLWREITFNFDPREALQ